MEDSRKKPGWAFWAIVVVVVALVGYPVSFGPTCWINHATGCGASAIPYIYRPIVLLAERQIDRLGIDRTTSNKIIVWYARIGMKEKGAGWPYVANDRIQWALFRSSSTW